ncbi:PspA/IM30 family protein [Alteraurantiacibacter aquimixticola]|uniref:PspA/IM30 family protein n=1 Tax=Alteraurantiacibacter aquimixticola TaxID=2489173 RepID=UPI00145BA779|nr:PspA/IM30 family protein [Alteraurantiacibacter aquimixticola]
MSSNVSGLVEAATDPAKMLKLLRKQIEETVISLQGDLSRTRRRSERLANDAQSLLASADSWQDKAKTAMAHQREDLARAALLAREDAALLGAKRQQEAKDAAAEVGEIETALAQLEAKHAETCEKLREVTQAAAGHGGESGGNPLSSIFADRGSATERKLESVERLEKRVAFATEGEDEPKSANIEQEIEGLQREARVEAELALLKSEGAQPAKPATRKRKAKG